MKKILKLIATVSILLFAVLWIASKFNFLPEFNTMDFRNLLVVIYLLTSLKFFQMQAKEKDAKIQELKLKLENGNREI